MPLVVSDAEKAYMDASGGDREGKRELFAVEVSKSVSDGIETEARTRSQDESGGYPFTGQAVPGT